MIFIDIFIVPTMFLSLLLTKNAQEDYGQYTLYKSDKRTKDILH